MSQVKRSTKLALSVVLASVLIAIGFAASASAAPSGLQARLQLAEDNLANCQLLASNATGNQLTRAQNCVADNQAIINLINAQLNPTPVPSTSSTSPAPSVTVTTPAPSTTTPSPSPTVTTPTPTPSPTGPSTTLKNCFNYLHQCGYPDHGDTGVPVGTVLTTYTGPETITVAGTVINGKSMKCVNIKAANVVIRNSKITGPCFYGVEMISGSLLIEYSEVTCVDGTGTGIADDGFTASHVYVHDCENGFSLGSNNIVRDSYISAREATSAGHGDGIQSVSATNVTIQHNTFDLFNPVTSSIIMDNLTMKNLLVRDNFVSSGALTIYCPEATSSNVQYINNRFYGPVGNTSIDPRRPAYGYTDGCNVAAFIWVGNYRDYDLGVVNKS